MTVLWVSFIGFVLFLLALDLGVFHRHAHEVSVKEALGWSAVWISLGLAFSFFVYAGYNAKWFGLGTQIDTSDGVVLDGATATVKYLTGYVIEKSLSIDNIFVIAMIFGFFAVPAIYQHRVLFWGILGALVMRGAMIALGATLIARFHWVLYVFGVLLVLTGLKMLFLKTEEADPGQQLMVRLTRRFFPVTEKFHGQHFVVRAGSAASMKSEVPGAEVVRDAAVEKAKPGAVMLTPLAVTLVLVESTDVIFAVDSIPAIFAVTADPFLVFTSNIFALLGLRSLYFALAGLLDKFRYLKVSLALVLILVGVKMLSAKWLKAMLGENFNFYLLGAVLLVLGSGVVASLVADKRDARAAE